MWFESLLVFILFKFKKRPNISGIRVVKSSGFDQAHEGEEIFLDCIII